MFNRKKKYRKKPQFISSEDAEFMQKERVRFMRFLVFILVIIAPLVFIMLIFAPIASKNSHDILVKNYSLPKDFTTADVVQVVANMKNDREFQFYFYALTDERIAEATFKAFEALNNNRTEKKMRSYMESLKERVYSDSTLFYHMEYPPKFIENPSKYPDLNRLMWGMITQEFTLTIVGTCFKANYDSDFSFEWNKAARLSAFKLRDIIVSLNNKE